MLETSRPGSTRALVENEKGLISREIFVDTDIYQQELERVFTRSWLFIGHESQVPKPNDFFVSRMGEESVILTRDRQGEIHVLLNTCRHRGMKVCRYDEGNTPVFSCPYHGWSYSTDGNLVSVPGELIGVPQFATAYHGELEKEEWGLISVPKMHVYKGSVWACWDKDAPEFDEYLGGMKPFLDTLFAASDGEDGLALDGVQKWMFPGNWKLAAENFIGDFYHGISHRSAGLGGGVMGRRDRPQDAVASVFYSWPGGHGTRGYRPDQWTAELSGDSSKYLRTYENKPHLNEFMRKSWEAQTQRYGGRGRGASVSTVFPNMSTLDNMSSGGGLTVAVWHPVGPMMTEAWRWYFVDKKAPAEIRDFWRKHRMTWSGPTGMVENDDMENWNYATEASNGIIARQYDYHYAQGLGHETRDTKAPDALLSDAESSEQNQRGFYKRWAEIMDASSWDELRT